MSKPKVTLLNHENVYDYYEKHRPNKLANKTLHATLGLIIRPQVQFAPGARDAMRELIGENAGVIIAANHTSNFDPPVIASLASREKVMRPLRGETSVLAKQSLFKNMVLRGVIDSLFAVPAFRAGDAKNPDGSINEELTALQRQASMRSIELSKNMLDDGLNLAIFPEGTRNKSDNPQRIQNVKRGLGEIVCGVSSSTLVAIFPTGIYYGPSGLRTNYTPSVHIGVPLVGPFESPESVTNSMQVRLQDSVSSAFEVY